MPATALKRNEAAFFFREDSVHKEMFFSEFEAVLDGFVGLPEYGGKTVRAVLVDIDARLQICGAVFFRIPFEDDGSVADKWNLPLRHLLEHANRKLDMGSGPAPVACRSSCPVSWLSEGLWDPDFNPDSPVLTELRRAVQRNRLGIVVERDNDADQAPGTAQRPGEKQALGRKYRERLQTLQQRHKLELKARDTRFREEKEKLQADFAAQLDKRDAAIKELRRKLSRHRRRELELQEKLSLLEQRFTKLRDLYQQDIGHNDGEAARRLEALREEFEVEMREQLNQQALELNERIALREAELHDRAQRMVEQRDELARLRRENQRLMQTEGSEIVSRMATSGITFVAYHPGIEHLVLAPFEIGDYLDNVTAFVAERCGVSKEHYEQWLKHYRLPVCSARGENGESCGQPIEKVLRPQAFRAGISDCCERHREIAGAVEDRSLSES